MKKQLRIGNLYLSVLLIAIFLSMAGKGFSSAASAGGATLPTHVVDSLGRSISLQMPVNRVIALGNYRLEALKVLNASDKVVGIGSNAKKDSSYYFLNL